MYGVHEAFLFPTTYLQKCMILIICQTKILQCCKLYANIERNTIPTPNAKLVPHQPQYYLQPHYSHTSDVTQHIFTLTQLKQNIFEPNTSCFTQLLFASFSTNVF